VLLVIIVSGGRRLLTAVRVADHGAPADSSSDDQEPPTSSGTENLEAMQAGRNYQRCLVDAVRDEADLGKPVLDFGAGTGLHARALRAHGFDVRCVEPYPTLRDELNDDGIS